MEVEVVVADAGGTVQRQALRLAGGATVADALAALAIRIPDGGVAAVHGRVRALTDELHDGDRVEICPQLLADPKQARRSRARLRRPAAG